MQKLQGKYHEECFKPLDRVMMYGSDTIYIIDEQIHQWVFMHDNRNRKIERDVTQSNIFRVAVGDF